MSVSTSSSAPCSDTTTTVPPHPPPLERAPRTPGRASASSTTAVAAGCPKPMASYPRWLAAIRWPRRSGVTLGQRLEGGDTAPVFLDPEQRGGSNGIRLVGRTLGEVVGRGAPFGQEHPSVQHRRQVRRQRRAGSWLTHGQVRPAAPSTIRLPMKAAARARPYGAPPTSWAAPVGQPTSSSPSGSATTSATDAGRHRIGNTAPGVPSATVTWSMIPHGAPTTWFSASWQSAARSQRVDGTRRRGHAPSRPRAPRSTRRRRTPADPT